MLRGRPPRKRVLRAVFLRKGGGQGVSNTEVLAQTEASPTTPSGVGDTSAGGEPPALATHTVACSWPLGRKCSPNSDVQLPSTVDLKPSFSRRTATPVAMGQRPGSAIPILTCLMARRVGPR